MPDVGCSASKRSWRWANEVAETRFELEVNLYLMKLLILARFIQKLTTCYCCCCCVLLLLPLSLLLSICYIFDIVFLHATKRLDGWVFFPVLVCVICYLFRNRCFDAWSEESIWWWSSKSIARTSAGTVRCLMLR